MPLTTRSSLRRVERFGEFALEAEIARAIPERRPRDAGADVAAADAARFVLAVHLIGEKILGDDDVAFRTHHFRDAGDAARTVAQALGLHDDVDRTHDHLANWFRRQGETAHRDHRFETLHGFARGIRVQRTHRTVVAGVHRLQQVERFGSAHFADDDPFRAHAQAVADEIAHGDLAVALEGGGARFQPHDA